MADVPGATINVEVVYALPQTQTVLHVRMPVGATVRDAIVASRILEQHPEIDLDAAQVGIFGKRKPLAAFPRTGDRIEIYRPLNADPKQARRKRARRERAR